jgi:hypothetical protein
MATKEKEPFGGKRAQPFGSTKSAKGKATEEKDQMQKGQAKTKRGSGSTGKAKKAK